MDRRNWMDKGYATLLATLLLSACGGGGGYSGTCLPASACEAPTPTPAPTPAPTPSGSNGMTFSPNPVTVTYQSGTSTNFNVTATPTNPSEFAGASTIYAFIVDPNNVIGSAVNIAQNSSAASYTATLSTSASVPPGTYNGSFQLKVCADSQCVNQFPGSPWSEPYTITVTSNGAAP
jgi:hypothetical protein